MPGVLKNWGKFQEMLCHHFRERVRTEIKCKFGGIEVRTFCRMIFSLVLALIKHISLHGYLFVTLKEDSVPAVF